ncbi:MAG: DUF3450 domain-containing protein [Alcanivorax sp.]|nr:DUF3450 domain-containing protein [Alcanivorax sp.]
MNKPIGTLMVLAALAAGGVRAADMRAVTAEGEARASESGAAQNRVAGLDDESARLEAEYRQLLRTVDGLETYNRVLGEQVAAQESERQDMAASLDNAARLERRLVPLMDRMIERLDTFIDEDPPFQVTARHAAMDELRQRLGDPDAPVADTLRRVFEAYAGEAAHGRSLDSWRGTLELDGERRDVNLLRVGRVALMYRTLDGEALGAWDPGAGQWRSLDRGEYRRAFDMAMKIADKQAAPELIRVPLFGAREVTP